MNGWIEYFKGSDLVKKVWITDGMVYGVIDKKFREKKEDRMSIVNQVVSPAPAIIPLEFQQCVNNLVTKYTSELNRKEVELQAQKNTVAELRANLATNASIIPKAAEERIQKLSNSVDYAKDEFKKIAAKLEELQLILTNVITETTTVAASSLEPPLPPVRAGHALSVTQSGAAKPPKHRQAVTYRVGKKF